MSKWLNDMRINPESKPAQHAQEPSARPGYARRYGRRGSTPSADAVVEYIKLYLDRHDGRSPSLNEIRTHMGWKKNSSVQDCLQRLRQQGKTPSGFVFVGPLRNGIYR
jgi:hypothetical protein